MTRVICERTDCKHNKAQKIHPFISEREGECDSERVFLEVQNGGMLSCNNYEERRLNQK